MSSRRSSNDRRVATFRPWRTTGELLTEIYERVAVMSGGPRIADAQHADGNGLRNGRQVHTDRRLGNAVDKRIDREVRPMRYSVTLDVDGETGRIEERREARAGRDPH